VDFPKFRNELVQKLFSPKENTILVSLSGFMALESKLNSSSRKTVPCSSILRDPVLIDLRYLLTAQQFVMFFQIFLKRSKEDALAII